MLDVLFQNILPVFSMLALGFVLGRRGVFSAAEAGVVNRLAFLVLQPALIFPLIATVPFHAFEPGALGGYVLCEIVTFTLAWIVARRLFRRDPAEAWLLAMSTIFVNSMLYIWPISFLLYGEAAALPITAIVAWDASVSFAVLIVTLEAITNPSGGLKGALPRIGGNPILIAIVLGVAVNLAGVSVPAPLLTAAKFAGGGAAPLTLFALGVILSRQPLRPTPLVGAIAGLKLLAFPALVWVALMASGTTGRWHDLFLLSAAGPSGAMAFALALLHGVRTEAIAAVIVWTSVLSLVSMAWLA